MTLRERLDALPLWERARALRHARERLVLGMDRTKREAVAYAVGARERAIGATSNEEAGEVLQDALTMREQLNAEARDAVMHRRERAE